MSSEETVEPEKPVADSAPGEQPPSRIGGVIVLLVLAGVAVLLLKLLVTAFPYVAYFVAGVIACRGWQKAVGWIAQRRDTAPADGEAGDDEAGSVVGETWRVPTFHELCESLARVGTPHAHIAVLAHDLGTTPERVREALDACGVQVEAVRMQGRGSSTGVKGGSLPTPRSVVGAGQPINNDNNDTPGEGSEKGLTVEDIGLAGTIIRDPAETQQRRATFTETIDRFFGKEVNGS